MADGVYCKCGDSIFEGNDTSGLLCVNCACMMANENDNLRERTCKIRAEAKEALDCGAHDDFEKGYNRAMEAVVRILDGRL